MQQWRPFLPFIRAEQRPLAVLFGLTLLESLLGIAAPWPMKLIVDNAIGGASLPWLFGWLNRLPGAGDAIGLTAWLAVGTVLLFLVQQGLVVASSLLRAKLSNRLTYRISAQMFDRTQRASPLALVEQSSGDLVRRMTADAGCARDLIFGVLSPATMSAFTVISMFAIMLGIHWQMAILATAAAVPVFLLIHRYTGRMRGLARRSANEQGRMSAEMEQALSNIVLVKTSDRERAESQRLKRLSDSVFSANLALTWTEGKLNASSAAVTAIASGGLILLGGFAAIDGGLSLGELLVFLAYVAAFYGPLVVTHQIAGSYAMATASAERAAMTLALPPGVEDPDSPIDFPSEPGPIVFRDVTFEYRDGEPVLDGLSLEIEAGERVAIIGRSGSGKTTIASLLQRLFDPSGGSVMISGVSLSDYAVADVRSAIAIVQQDTLVLPISIAENISYGSEGATREQIEDAARAAQIHDFIEQLPDGYDTVLGQSGATVSGGQRQRIAIARALLKAAPIVILDEPTSSLDAEAEQLVLQSIERLTEGRTTIIISHNASAVLNADRVIALRDGQITGDWLTRDLEEQGVEFDELAVST